MRISIFIIFLIILVSSCSSSLNYRKKGSVNDAAFNAVINFAHNHKSLQKNDSVFRVIFFEEEYEKNTFYRLIVIGTKKQYLYNKTKFQSDYKFPSNYLELNNKIYIWYDDNKQIDSLTIATYKKYNLLVDNENGEIKFLDNDIIDEEQKGVIYFFCKDNLAKFEKQVSNKSTKYPKKLKCDD